MDSSNSETIEVSSDQQNFRGHWITRIVLLILHLAAVVAAASPTPDGSYFQLGADTGAVVMFSSVFLWILLFAAKTRRGIALFCCLVLAQAGFVAAVSMRLRAEDKISQSIGEEIEKKRHEWGERLNLDRMRPLAEMISGKRNLSVEQFQELKKQASDAQTQVDEVALDVTRSREEAERRFASVSARAAQNFRLGVESTKAQYEQEMSLTKDYFAKSEKLAGFLIDRQGQYSQTTEGLKFKKVEDAQSFNGQIGAISLLLGKIASLQHQLSAN